MHALTYTRANIPIWGREINACIHEAAVKMGVSDSVMNILYVICEKGDRCRQSEISRLTGISRQINSAIRKLEKDSKVYLAQGTGQEHHRLPDRTGQGVFGCKILPLFEMENKIWNEWTAEEQQAVSGADAEIPRRIEAIHAGALARRPAKEQKQS